MFNISSFDFIFIHRESAPLGPPIIEYIISKIWRKKIIYDFDDAIWLTDRIGESRISSALRFRKKVGLICKWSHLVCCGNDYLADYARLFSKNVVILPTTIDTALHTPGPERPGRKVTVGWTGSHSTLKYLKSLGTVLQRLAENHPDVQFIFIADEDPGLPLTNAAFIRWTKETEIEDLARIDIGIMPLPDDAWTRGKCGFKALQYMAMGIPAVLSPVGVNKAIVEHGVNGYLCAKDEEWLLCLGELIRDAGKRREMGLRGRKKVIDHYSVAVNADKFLSLFR